MILRRILLILLVLAVAGPAWLWQHKRAPVPVPATAIAGRFAMQDSGKTVLDRISGLHWQQGFSATTMTQAAALTWCSANTPALPGTGWRLPTSHELEDLADSQAASPAIDAVFAGTPSEFFWSATPWVSGGNAWVVDFYYGRSYYDGSSSAFRVRCVR